MINEIILDIKRYIEYVGKEHGLFVSLHDRRGRIQPFIHELAVYNIHNNPYCLYCKSSPALWQICVEKQEKVLKKCADGAFYGMCHAGVCEFVYPFYQQKRDARELAGFISVSGYRPAGDAVPERVEALPDLFSIPRDDLYRMYMKGLSPCPPQRELLDSIIPPLARMLELLLGEYSDVSGNSRAGSNENVLYYSLVNYIQRAHNHKIRVSDMARAFNCSSSYISHIFAKNCGKSVSRFVNELRIHEARLMLETTALSIQDIALTVGYSDANYFSNVFRSLCGTSPSQYASESRERRESLRK